MVTDPVVTVKEAVVAPCGTVTDEGTEAAELELESATVIPPNGAAAAMATVPRAVWPLKVTFGLTERMVGTIGFTVKLAPIFTPPLEAVSATEVAVVTVPAVAVKEALVAPCATVTHAGTDAAAFELERAIAIPPPVAGAEMVTVPDAV